MKYIEKRIVFVLTMLVFACLPLGILGLYHLDKGDPIELLIVLTVLCFLAIGSFSSWISYQMFPKE